MCQRKFEYVQYMLKQITKWSFYSQSNKPVGWVTKPNAQAENWIDRLGIDIKAKIGYISSSVFWGVSSVGRAPDF